ncbi:Aste57867_21257 [Aphanomyces stellatus]|uniref:Aste57867_21257 protein n=1 Tax=Aphanomyces stellatus TaxID=120398 RepID=A0A485LH37_9STRA|nr:hypothetical protein As57867_021188 [Aphanomyces stellatus]VFT97929.1 Aste57867_21257 [Aphanomyces stellatus]
MPNPWPLQVVLVLTFLVCLGVHFDLLPPISIKDYACTKAMHFNNDGRPWACVTHIKYSTVGMYALGLQMVPFFLLLLTSFAPELLCLLFALGSILSSLHEVMKEHLDDVEERINDALDAKTEPEGEPVAVDT